MMELWYSFICLFFFLAGKSNANDDWNGGLLKQQCVTDFFRCQQSTSLLDPKCRDKYVACLMGKSTGDANYHFQQLIEKCWSEVALGNSEYCQRIGRNNIDWYGCALTWNKCMENITNV